MKEVVNWSWQRFSKSQKLSKINKKSKKIVVIQSWQKFIKSLWRIIFFFGNSQKVRAIAYNYANKFVNVFFNSQKVRALVNNYANKSLYRTH